ncbi:MAG: hypothetical protein PHF31_16265 [Methylobacter sp.]|nr:hypothetical protein [Methylobacter sp.]
MDKINDIRITTYINITFLFDKAVKPFLNLANIAELYHSVNR